MKRDLSEADAVAADQRLMDQIVAENDEALREQSLRERNEWFHYELDHGAYRVGTDLIAPCGCKGMVAGDYWLSDGRHLQLGEIEACGRHS